MRHGTLLASWIICWALFGGATLRLVVGCTSQGADAVAPNSRAGSDDGPLTSGGAGASAGSVGMAGGAVSISGGAGADTAGSSSVLPDAGQAAGQDAGTADVDAATPVDGDPQSLPKRVLLYHYSTLDIPSVPAQLDFFERQLATWEYQVDDSVDPATISDENLGHYAAVAMINTCFEPFGKARPDIPQSQVLQRFLQRGGGLFGTHCASVTFQSAKPPVLYNQILGGRGGDGSFDGTSGCRTLGAHPTTSQLPASFSFTGNLDNTDYLAADTTVLLKCRWQGGAAKDVNVSWYRQEGLGRIFYTNFGKVAADLTDATLGPHIVGGLAWVLHVP